MPGTTTENIPLEVTLTKVPARPGCYIYKQFECAFDMITYMRLMKTRSIPDPYTYTPSTIDLNFTPLTMSDSAAKETPKPVSDFQRTLDELDEDQRKIIQENIKLVLASQQAAVKRTTAVEEELKSAKNLAQTSDDALRVQVAILRNQIDDTILQGCGLTDKLIQDNIGSKNLEASNAVMSQMIRASSAQLSALAGSNTNKRRRVQQTEPAPAANPEPEPAPMATGNSFLEEVQRSGGTEDIGNDLLAALASAHTFM